MPTVLAFYGGDHPVKFTEERTRKNFSKFVKRFTAASVAELWSGNIENEISDFDRTGLPWIIQFEHKNQEIDNKSNFMEKLGKQLLLIYCLRNISL